MNKNFSLVSASPSNPNWDTLTGRESPLYSRGEDIRTDFGRDYTRILHSNAYRRLKHKTQVFFNVGNDHICTRMEHVNHVESVSCSIAKALGLNEELTGTIALGHDLGHAPFGHQGESIIKELALKHLNENFWHEKNGLVFVDNIELLSDISGLSQNLNLTYAVRDGIISHCGEVDENGIKPRDIDITIDSFDEVGKYQAVTWEGCVVKLSDKIAYLGRDIEDAISLGIMGKPEIDILEGIASNYHEPIINTTVIMHNMIIDICKNSSPKNGICLSKKYFDMMKEVKEFNYAYIYKSPRLSAFKDYATLIINKLFETLLICWDKENTWKQLALKKAYAPTFISEFEAWMCQYCDEDIVPEHLKKISQKTKNNKLLGSLPDKNTYIKAILLYISGMTDRFAIQCFEELITF